LRKCWRKKKAKKLANQKDLTKFSSILSVTNIPATATAADVKTLFPDAIELKFIVAKELDGTSTAIVTLPTPQDATNSKRKPYKIGDKKLVVHFALNKSGKIKTKKPNKNKDEKKAR